ncbi:unnamed protein product [Lactuca virosa]|uniref:Uncharacterized protein n=1 Tax=Lactuca virosa TaxID=75947 RepID=A0AAU9PA75_9ASTR|nr:unnamed protein product [Lactuca virosa]
MDNTIHEVFLSPAMAPITPCSLLSHNRRYAVDGEIMAFVVIIVFSIFIFFLIIAPHLMQLRRNSRSFATVDQNHGDVYQRNRNHEDIV